MAKIVSAQTSAVTRGQRLADRRTEAEDERDSRAACAGYGSCVVSCDSDIKKRILL